MPLPICSTTPRIIYGFYPPIAVYSGMLDKLTQPKSSIQNIGLALGA